VFSGGGLLVGFDLSIVVFDLSGQTAAIVADHVYWVVPTEQPQNWPDALPLLGKSVPVFSLEGLLKLPMREPHAETALIILRDFSLGLAALVVDRIIEILSVPSCSLLPVRSGNFLNGYVAALVLFEGQTIHLLSTGGVLQEYERACCGNTGTSRVPNIRHAVVDRNCTTGGFFSRGISTGIF
jgi:chemotaxis signal transduction protein